MGLSDLPHNSSMTQNKPVVTENLTSPYSHYGVASCPGRSFVRNKQTVLGKEKVSQGYQDNAARRLGIFFSCTLLPKTS